MTKIWEKNSKISMNKKVENFLSADDILFDQQLAVFDIYGSLGHLVGLLDAGLVNEGEYKKMKVGLIKILDEVMEEEIILAVSDEDIHTAIENKLKNDIGSPADKLHTCRSRNDQISVDLKLFSKNELLEIMNQILDLASSFLKFAEQHKQVAMPGYTHMQKGMVSSVGLWASSFTASLMDDYISLQSAFDLNNQSPLGSAAGYGIPLKIKKGLVAKSLGFKKVQENYLYCQNSRGKIELAIVHALQQIVLTINKFANDLMLFTMGEFGYFYLPDNFLTGSSIMAQKKNYDVLELLRSKQASMSGNYNHLNCLISNLPSGYNRDFQEIKKPLFSSFKITKEVLEITNEVISNLSVNEKLLKKSITTDLLVTNEVYKLVEEGMSFKEAYKLIGNQYHNSKKMENIEYKLPNFDNIPLKNMIDSQKKLDNEKYEEFNKKLNKLAV